MGKENVPRDYGGTCELALGEADEDRAYAAFVAARATDGASAAAAAAATAADEGVGTPKEDTGDLAKSGAKAKGSSNAESEGESAEIETEEMVGA